MPYQEIIFIEGSDAEYPLSILKRDIDRCFDYLLRWDYGEGAVHPLPSHGKCDRVTIRDDLILSWNTGIGYIGLERFIGDV
jgi:hypothetical protein